MAALILAVGVVAASCARSDEFSGDVKTSESSTTTTAPGPAENVAPSSSNGPTWYLKGVASSRAEIASRDVLKRPLLTAPPATLIPVIDSGLPPRAQFVGGLKSLGIQETSATCIYDQISAGPATADAAGIFKVLAAQTGGAKSLDIATISAVQKIDAGSIKRFIVAVAPCLDTTTLLALLAQTGGLGGSGAGSPGSTTGLALLVSQLGTVGLGGLSGINLGAIAGKLPSDQTAALAAFLAAAAGGKIGNLDVNKFDISKLDLKKLGSEQIVLLLAAFARGLSPEQSGQLNTLARFDLGKLGLSIDSSKLTTDQAGALLVLFLPFLSTGLQPAGSGPPPGADAGQIYVPPGADLSQINPLYFVPRENVILGFARQGINDKLGGCLYDKLRVINPQLIGLAFGGTDISAAGQILLAIFGCLLV